MHLLVCNSMTEKVCLLLLYALRVEFKEVGFRSDLKYCTV